MNKPILFFVHGWPDSADLWQHQISHFEKKFRCVSVTLPYFDNPPQGPVSGFDFPELVAQLISQMENVLAESNQKKLVLVGHDWGAYLVYLIEKTRPDLVSQFVTMDVGGHLVVKSLGHLFFIVSYQWWLVAAFFVGKVISPFGDFMSGLISGIGKAPRGSAIWYQMNYPYFYFWRGNLVKRYQGNLLKQYRPTRPLLYLYGKKKFYHFHSPKWEEIVKDTPGSRVVGLENCDHWLMLRNPEETNRLMEEWIL